ncbi:hypothetical protein LNKW23_43570 [Paralimibaculum aggregatum]|uniref:Transposase n=1 Tax=Paralimibaculum aggregatum TaxID=3036245 RepID=A0ABQ6LSU5_9RHOB|nr:hypothetical protein LNKW23_43570 [Limibaculum sp. NKW23]
MAVREEPHPVHPVPFRRGNHPAGRPAPTQDAESGAPIHRGMKCLHVCKFRRAITDRLRPRSEYRAKNRPHTDQLERNRITAASIHNDVAKT